MDSWEAGSWASPSGPRGTSLAGDIWGIIPPGCFRCRGPLVLAGPLDLRGIGSDVACSLARPAALEALEVLVAWIWLQGASRGTCEDWLSSSESDSSVWWVYWNISFSFRTIWRLGRGRTPNLNGETVELQQRANNFQQIISCCN